MTPPAQFARQTIRLQFPKDIHWGDDMTVWVAKTGDIARTMYLRVTWPLDGPLPNQPSAGTAMIDRVELSYKDQLIERIYGENLYMLGDTRVPQAKQNALSTLVGGAPPPPAPVPVVYSFPPVAMTGYSLLHSSGYGQGTYIASASSEFSSGFRAWHAFDNDTSSTQRWASGPNTYSSGLPSGIIPVTTDINGATYSGSWIQFQMPVTIIPTAYNLAVATNTSFGARSFALLGSNDGVSWSLIDSQTGITTWVLSTIKTFTVQTSQYYSYLRIVNRTIGTGVTDGGYSYISFDGTIYTPPPVNLMYHIPMPFSILEKGLPLIALDEAPKFRVVFKPSTFFTTGTAYTKPIQVDLFVEYVYVTQAERDYLTSHELIYTTESFQRMQFRVPPLATQSSVQFLTSFVNDVKELYWVIQGDNASNVYDYGTTDQLVNLQLTLNSIDRITPDYATAQYLRVIQGLQFHTRVPNGRYYMYSFALEPELNEPSGEINMTNITRQQHTLTLAPSTSARSVRIYALSFNLFSVSKGDGVSLHTLQEG